MPRSLKDILLTRYRALAALLLLLTLCTHSAVAEEWLQLPSANSQITSAGVLQYIEDPLAQLSLSYILSQGTPFARYPEKAFNEGFTTSAFWLKLPIDAGHTSHKRWLLEINYPLIDVVNATIHNEQGEVLQHLEMGDLHPFNQRDFHHRNFVIPFDFSDHERQVLYLNVQTTSSLQVPISLWEVNAFVEQRSTEQYGLGLYYGMMLVMFLYNFFLWLSIRDTNYLTYIGYIAAFAFLQLATSGLGYQFIWPESPWLQQIAVPLTIGLVGIFGSAFTRGFLQTPVYHRWADVALRLCIALSLGICLSALVLDIATVMSIGKFVVVIFLITVLYSSIATLVMGQHQARYFLAAWLALIIGGLTTIIMMLGHLPNNVWTTHASKIGSALEIVLLSFALADRIKILERAKNKAEATVKRELEERAERLAESNRLKNDFLATISHEFRTPLNGMLGSLELADELNGTALQHALQDARSSAREMLELVDTVLTYTELQAGNRILLPETIATRELLQGTIDQVAQQCANKNLSFRLHLDPALPELVRTDIKCVRHAMRALLENAVKFTPAGEISLEAQPGLLNQLPCLDIRIRDTGIGMTPAELNRVQEYFGQLDSSFQRQYQGLGIGLSLVRSICHSLKGQISIHSQKHEGTDVHLRLPVQTPMAAEKSAQHDDSLAPVLSDLRGKALIVEDNAINQRVLQSMLVKLQLQADVADNGEKALEILRSSRESYQLIFMDCQMPVMDGFEATRMIRASELAVRHCPIIAVTANAMTGDEQRCREAGMNDYLSKPISMEQVRTMVQKWLNQVSHPTTASDQPPESPARTNV